MKARQGERGFRGLTVPLHKLDRAVVDHLEWRLHDPRRDTGWEAGLRRETASTNWRTLLKSR
jgi:hypothetical protein